MLAWPTTAVFTTFNAPKRSKTTVTGDRRREVRDVSAALFAQWSDAAMSHAMVKAIGHEEFVATVAGIQGALGYGSTEKEALDSLRSALADWVHVHLEHGGDDIPVQGGVNINPA